MDCPPPPGYTGIDLDLSKEAKETLQGVGKSFETGAKLILGGLVFVGVAEIVGHRFMRVTNRRVSF